MELLDYIEQGEKEAGGPTKLADYLGVSRTNIPDAKSGKRGLPGFACVKLAELIGASEIEVIAASELVTEKKPERRAIWSPFVQGTVRHALGLALMAVAINFVTPSPAQAAQNLNTKVITICIM